MNATRIIINPEVMEWITEHSHLIKLGFTATSNKLSTLSFGLVSPAICSILLLTLLRSTVLNIVYLITTELQFQALNYWYRKGYLKRFQAQVPEERDLYQVYIGASSVTLPVSLFESLRMETFLSRMTFDVNFKHMFILMAVMLAVQDTWYFWGHRFMHRNKFFWNNVHVHHHEKKNINVYATGYAAFVENLILIAPVFIGVKLFQEIVLGSYNPITWGVVQLSQMAIFNVGHCGFKFHYLMYLLGPPHALLQQVPRLFGWSEAPEDHEMHHLYPTCNYSLNFTFWDKMMGCYKPIDVLESVREKAKTT